MNFLQALGAFGAGLAKQGNNEDKKFWEQQKDTPKPDGGLLSNGTQTFDWSTSLLGQNKSEAKAEQAKTPEAKLQDVWNSFNVPNTFTPYQPYRWYTPEALESYESIVARMQNMNK